jgi:predicted ATPase
VETVEARCEELARRGQFLRPAGVEPWAAATVTARFEFRHAMHQQVLYDQVAPGRRARLHHRIADRLEAAWGGRSVEIASGLAIHFERGQDPGRAARYHRDAAQNAVRRSAYAEAHEHLVRALTLLAQLPETRERTREELATLLTLAPVLMVIKGDASPEVERAYNKARALCEDVGTPGQLIEVIWGAWRFAASSANLPKAHALGEELLALAERINDKVAQAEAHRMIGQSLLYSGEFAGAHLHFEASASTYRSALLLRGDPGSRFGRNVEVTALTFDAVGLWVCGHPDRALIRCHEALARAHELERPVSLNFALTWLAWIHYFRREGALTYERAEAAMAIATEHGAPQRWAQAAIFRGGALAIQGRLTEGIAQIAEGIAAHLATGARVGRPFNLATLAEAQLAAGKIEAARGSVAEAFTVAEAMGDLLWEAELHRLSGELHLADSPRQQDEAEASFHRALETARRQGAMSLELRAAVSLGRLWRRQRKSDAARSLLSKVRSQLTEGVDTGDIRDASALLAELR